LTRVVGVRVLKPPFQQRLQLAHVLEGEVQGLEPGTVVVCSAVANVLYTVHIYVHTVCTSANHAYSPYVSNNSIIMCLV
jgi:hypothetical protein